MPFCYYCGCELERAIALCPVCQKRVVVPPDGEGDVADVETRYPEVTLPDELPAKRKVWLLWRMVTVLAVITLGVLAVADAMGASGMSWSLYAMPSVLTAWWLFTALLWFSRHAGLLVAWLGPALVGCLVLLDLADGRLQWFLPLGLPITGIASAYILLLWGVRRGLSGRWPLVVWVGLLLLVPVCMGLELLIDSYRAAPGLRWSLVAVAVILPVAAFLAYLNVYLRRYRIDLWRYLHTR